MTVEQTHNMSLYMDIRRRLYQATGDAKYSLDQEECTQFIMATNKKAAVTVSCAGGLAVLLCASPSLCPCPSPHCSSPFSSSSLSFSPSSQFLCLSPYSWNDWTLTLKTTVTIPSRRVFGEATMRWGTTTWTVGTSS